MSRFSERFLGVSPYALEALDEMSPTGERMLFMAVRALYEGDPSHFLRITRFKARTHYEFAFNDNVRGLLVATQGGCVLDKIYVQIGPDSWQEARGGGFLVGSVSSPAAAHAKRAVSLAAWVAGSRRSHLHDEWAAILAGCPENGVTFSRQHQAWLALGFLFAAGRMRLRDVVRPFWRPVDWMLRTESRTNGFIATIIGTQATYIVGDDGLAALVTDVWEPCGIAGAALFVLTRWLRRVRGIELATPEREPADE